MGKISILFVSNAVIAFKLADRHRFPSVLPSQRLWVKEGEFLPLALSYDAGPAPLIYSAGVDGRSNG